MTEPRPARIRHQRLLAVCCAVAVLIGLGVWWWWPATDTTVDKPPPTAAAVVDPRLAYTGPFRNIHPSVKYVGDAACAQCHADLCASYAQHPMGQAMATAAAATPIERFDAKSHNPFQGGELWYEVRRDSGQVVHCERVPGPGGKALAESQSAARYAVGSGAKARSYLIERDGYLFQSPVTWFIGGQRWDLSPSYEIRNWHFTRAVTPSCLFCHCNHADHVEGTDNRYRTPIFNGFAIGCERCHGPGELHVAERERRERLTGAVDYTIVNPARLEHHLREAICQQCHLQGEERVVGRGRSDWDFRPGLPLHPFLMDFVDGRAHTGGDKFVNAVEQMMSSRCYNASREPKKLGCTSCHDAHAAPVGAAAKAAHYRSRCLNCHNEQSCSAPAPARKARNDSCIACHMPQGNTEVNHSSKTNHAIPRREMPFVAGRAPRRSTPGPNDMVPFHREQIPPGDPEAERNVGIARMAMLNRGLPRSVAQEFALAALPPLDRAIARDPADWPAVEARGDALWLVGRKDEAFAAYRTAVAARPHSERTQFGAGAIALDLAKLDDARRHLHEAIRINPWRPHYHHELAVAAFRAGDRRQAASSCLQALQLEPTRTATRSLLIQAYLWDGFADKAQVEFNRLRAMTPQDKRAELDIWLSDEKGRVAKSVGLR